MRYLGIFLTEIKCSRGIGATYVSPIIGIILDKKTPKLKYDGPILGVKWEGLTKAIHNYLMMHIQNMPGFHEDTIYHLDFGD